MAILTQNYRGTRTPSTPYRNTSGYWLLCVAVQTGNDQITAYTSAVSTPMSTQVWDSFGVPIFTRGSSAIFPVPPNWYYQINNAGTLNVLEVSVGIGSITDSGNISGSRSLASNYQNTSGGAQLVIVQVSDPASPADLIAYSDNTATPSASNIVWKSHSVANGVDSCGIIVPNGHYYRVESAGATVVAWHEYALPFQMTKVDVTASRSLNSVYRNTGSDGMFVSVVHGTPSSSGGSRYVYADASNPPTTAEFFQQTSSSGAAEGAGFVLSNWYYEATTDGTETPVKWWEYTPGSLSVGGRILQCAQP